MTRILLQIFLFLAFQLNLFANPGNNAPVPSPASTSKIPHAIKIDLNTDFEVLLWENTSTVEYAIPQFFVQKTNRAGDLFWRKNIELTNGDRIIQSSHKLIPDGNGGVIITWEQRPEDIEETDLYAQRIDSEGSKLWGETGIIVNASSGSQISPFIVTDGQGGAIIAWTDSRNDPGNKNWDIYAQHLNSNGDIEWLEEGVVLSSDSKDEYIGQLLAEKNGGFTIVWNMVIPNVAGEGEGYEFFTKKIDSKGGCNTTLASTKFLTLPVGTTKYRLGDALLDDGNGGFFLSLLSNVDNKDHRYLQHVNPSGNATFKNDLGILINASINPDEIINYQVDTLGNLTLTFQENTDSLLLTTIQKFDAEGHVFFDSTAQISTQEPEPMLSMAADTSAKDEPIVSFVGNELFLTDSISHLKGNTDPSITIKLQKETTSHGSAPSTSSINAVITHKIVENQVLQSSGSSNYPIINSELGITKLAEVENLAFDPPAVYQKAELINLSTHLAVNTPNKALKRPNFNAKANVSSRPLLSLSGFPPE
ncbi:MAG: hypothetical protein H7Y13_07495 [Sphingobacteriaceae bacterium]|nr:hypothetical protein [Sphingobacteriaceae bacterium]